MIQIHAPDAPGQAAHKASQFASVLSFNLLAGASPTIDTAKRLEALERVFTIWPALCREMKALELAAPRCSASGLEQAARLADFAEARPSRTPQSAGASSREGQR